MDRVKSVLIKPFNRSRNDDDTKQIRKDWLEEVGSLKPEAKLSHAAFLWNEYQHRHNLIWNLVFRLTAAVVALAVIPYTQLEVMRWLGAWILAPPILGVVLAIGGYFRVRNELKILDNIRDLYRPLQYSLFYKFDEDNGSAFGQFVRFYIVFLAVLAAINILLIDFCWLPALTPPELLVWLSKPFDWILSWIQQSWVCPTSKQW